MVVTCCHAELIVETLFHQRPAARDAVTENRHLMKCTQSDLPHCHAQAERRRVIALGGERVPVAEQEVGAVDDDGEADGRDHQAGRTRDQRQTHHIGAGEPAPVDQDDGDSGDRQGKPDDARPGKKDRHHSSERRAGERLPALHDP